MQQQQQQPNRTKKFLKKGQLGQVKRTLKLNASDELYDSRLPALHHTYVHWLALHNSDQVHAVVRTYKVHSPRSGGMAGVVGINATGLWVHLLRNTLHPQNTLMPNHEQVTLLNFHAFAEIAFVYLTEMLTIFDSIETLFVLLDGAARLGQVHHDLQTQLHPLEGLLTTLASWTNLPQKTTFVVDQTFENFLKKRFTQWLKPPCASTTPNIYRTLLFNQLVPGTAIQHYLDFFRNDNPHVSFLKTHFYIGDPTDWRPVLAISQYAASFVPTDTFAQYMQANGDTDPVYRWQMLIDPEDCVYVDVLQYTHHLARQLELLPTIVPVAQPVATETYHNNTWMSESDQRIAYGELPVVSIHYMANWRQAIGETVGFCMSLGEVGFVPILSDLMVSMKTQKEHKMSLLKEIMVLYCIWRCNTNYRPFLINTATKTFDWNALGAWYAHLAGNAQSQWMQMLYPAPNYASVYEQQAITTFNTITNKNISTSTNLYPSAARAFIAGLKDVFDPTIGYMYLPWYAPNFNALAQLLLVENFVTIQPASDLASSKKYLTINEHILISCSRLYGKYADKILHLSSTIQTFENEYRTANQDFINCLDASTPTLEQRRYVPVPPLKFLFDHVGALRTQIPTPAARIQLMERMQHAPVHQPSKRAKTKHCQASNGTTQANIRLFIYSMDDTDFLDYVSGKHIDYHSRAA